MTKQRSIPWRAICAIALLVPVLNVGAAESVPPSDAAIQSSFLERRQWVMQQALTKIAESAGTQGNYLEIAACLQAGQHVDLALKRLAELNEPLPTANMFWAYPMVAVMAAGRAHLNEAAWARIQELWKIYWPSRGDTENHWALSYAARYIVAQTWPEAGPDKWFNGRSSAENLADARDYLNHWMRVTTSYGQGEYDSPNYIEEYVIPMALLASWADDPDLRLRARMMLDYLIYDYAVENVGGYYGGAHSRVYPRQIITPGATYGNALGWLLFGLGDAPNRAYDGNTLLALSGYVPPPILERVARDRTQPYVERELKRTRWRMRHAGPHSFVIGDKRTLPVYKYSYVDREFVLGSTQGGLLQPIQQQTWSLKWPSDQPADAAANTFFAVQPFSSPTEGTMYFGADWDTVTDLIARSKADYDTPDKLPSGSPYEQVFQHGAALVALYDLPPANRFPHILTFFSRDLRNVTEDPSGWIFAQGGPAYIAYRPFAPGEWRRNDWTGLLAGGAGGFISSGFDQWGQGHRVLKSDALKNGYVVQIAPGRDYATFEAFQAAVRALPLSFTTSAAPEVTFTSLAGDTIHLRYGDTPTVNGTAVDYANWPLFESPFAQEKRGSQKLEIKHGRDRYLLDFKRPLIKQTVE